MNLKAFSLLEMIIVLAVLAAIMGLGWSGLINFRSTAEMQNAYSEMVSVIKTEQNKAKNSVSSGSSGTTPYFYALFFSNDKYYAFNCGDSRTPSLSTTNIRCTKDETVNFRLLPSEIELVPDASCAGIGFTKLTGKFASFTLPITESLETVTSFDTIYNLSGQCNIKIRHNSISAERTIGINLDINSLDVE